jgi:hypothetical protein
LVEDADADTDVGGEKGLEADAPGVNFARRSGVAGTSTRADRKRLDGKTEY